MANESQHFISNGNRWRGPQVSALPSPAQLAVKGDLTQTFPGSLSREGALVLSQTQSQEMPLQDPLGPWDSGALTSQRS